MATKPGKKPETDSETRTPPNRKGKPLHAWIDSALRDAFEDARKKNRRSLKDELSIALEKYLESLKLWPPKS